MRKIVLLSILIVFCGFAKAEIITSCDKDYVAKIVTGHEVVVLRGGQRVAAMKIDHRIDGGAFSLDDSVLVVFGLPFKVDSRFPQVSHLSIYFIGRNIRPVAREVYGGGVYSAEFSEDRKWIVINSQFGVDVMNIEKKQVNSFDAAHVPKFRTQKCEAR